MIALLLGLLAAFCWSAHDLLARALSPAIRPFRLGLWIMLIGAAVLVPPVLWRGQIWQADQASVLLALAMGVVYAGAAAGLLTAYANAPVSIVGPFTAGYPALAVLWGIVNGLVPTWLQLLAMTAILSGAIIVGRNSADDGGMAKVQAGKLPLVLASSLIAALCYAAAIILGQTATEILGEYETSLLSRLPAAAILAVLARWEPPAEVALTRLSRSAILLMAVTDVIAVTAINAATFFPGKELGAMAISCFGAITVLLAMVFLKEKVTALQWLGIVMITAGVAGLAI